MATYADLVKPSQSPRVSFLVVVVLGVAAQLLWLSDSTVIRMIGGVLAIVALIYTWYAISTSIQLLVNWYNKAKFLDGLIGNLSEEQFDTLGMLSDWYQSKQLTSEQVLKLLTAEVEARPHRPATDE